MTKCNRQIFQNFTLLKKTQRRRTRVTRYMNQLKGRTVCRRSMPNCSISTVITSKLLLETSSKRMNRHNTRKSIPAKCQHIEHNIYHQVKTHWYSTRHYHQQHYNEYSENQSTDLTQADSNTPNAALWTPWKRFKLGEYCRSNIGDTPTTYNSHIYTPVVHSNWYILHQTQTPNW